MGFHSNLFARSMLPYIMSGQSAPRTLPFYDNEKMLPLNSHTSSRFETSR
jgi:hypothetical protein